MVFWLLLLLCLPLGNAHSLKDHLKIGKKGDYALFQQGKLLSLLHIRGWEQDIVTIEEITLPLYEGKKIQDWQGWIQKGAPGSTSWVVFAVDLEHEKLIEAFSHTKGAFLQVSSVNTFFTKLLSLPLREIPQEERRKIGPPPLGGEPDRRSLWKPPMTVQGNPVPSPTFAVYSCSWPKDATPLSEKTIALYFGKNRPFPFPFWVEVRGEHGAVYAKILTAGSNLQAPFLRIPRQCPRFISALQERGNYYFLAVLCPSYDQEYCLEYLDQNGTWRPLAFRWEKETEKRVLRIEKSALDSHAQALRFSVKDHPERSCHLLRKKKQEMNSL